MKRILIEVHEGRMACPLFDNGLLDHLTEGGNQVLVAGPAARIPRAVERWKRPGVEFRHVELSVTVRRPGAFDRMVGRWLSTRGHTTARKRLWELVGEREAAATAGNERALIEEFRPDVVVATHLTEIYGRGFVAVARRLGIPTLGNMVSWDNMFRPLQVRPDRITCWSEQNRHDTARLCGYREDEIEVVGAPAFDAYLASDAQWTREELCARLGLNPARPIIVFATLGQMYWTLDETSSFEVFLDLLDSGRIEGNPQIVLRMHPISREPFFRPFEAHPAVTVSRYEGYLPWMAWAPWREEVVFAGNLLRHADVCVSPGSTMTIETALFDTPTVMPVINEYQPERYRRYIEEKWLLAHFKPMADDGLLPIAWNRDELADMVNRALADPSWFREERRKIRDRLLGPLDGRSTERLARAILRSAGAAR